MKRSGLTLHNKNIVGGGTIRLSVDFVSTLALLYLMLLGVDFGYLARMERVPNSFYSNYTPSELLSLLLLAGLFAFPKTTTKYIANNSVLLLVALSLSLTTILATVYVYATGLNTPFSISGRISVQIVSLLSAIAVGCAISFILNKYPQKARASINIGVFLAIVGVVFQFADQGLAAISNRLYGVSGEPKGLGLFLVPFITAVAMIKLRNVGYFVTFLFLVSILVVILTFSTTAVLSAGASILAILLFNKGVAVRGRIIVASLLGLILYIFVSIQVSGLEEKLIGRLFDRAEGIGISGVTALVSLPVVGNIVVDGNDAPAIAWLLDAPIVSLFGTGYGFDAIFADYYVGRIDSGFVKRGYFGYITPNMAVLENTLRYGLIPLAALGFHVLTKFRRSLATSVSTDLLFLRYYFFSSFVISLLVMDIGISLITSYIVISSSAGSRKT
ncbi:MAG: hypothetical protein ABJ084_00210 [Halioglobus sp.]